MGLFDLFKKKPIQQPYSTYKPNPIADTYFKHMEQINVMWSVLSNLKTFTGEQAQQLESLCIQNISEYKQYVQYYDGIEPPHHAPAFVRLAMLYEKQQEYEKGINVCVDAIRSGAYEDNSKGKMYGRLARLINKSGITVDQNILKLTKGS